MGSWLGKKQVTPSETAGSHLGSHVVHRLQVGIGEILHGTKLGSRVGLVGSHLGFKAGSHAGLAGFCLECS